MEVLGFSVPLWLVLIVAALALYTYMMSRHHGTFKKLNIPGPAPWPVIGSLIEINTGGFQKFQVDCMKKYGKVYGFYGGLSPMTLEVGDTEMLRTILVKDFVNFTDRILLYFGCRLSSTFEDLRSYIAGVADEAEDAYSSWTLGVFRMLDLNYSSRFSDQVFKGFNGDVDTGINNLSGDHWKHVRSKITPAFSTGKLRKMVPLIDHASDTLVESLRRKVKSGKDVIEMMEVFGAYTMDVICSTAFGIQIDSQNNPNDEFVVNARKFLILKLASPLIIILIFFPKLHFLMPMFGWSFLDKDIQVFFRNVTTKLLADRIAGDKSRVDFLQLMKNAQYDKEDSDEEDDNENENDSVKKPASSWSRKGITFDEILGNAETFFFAGYETTTITLSMASYYLAMYPEYQDKLRRELLDKIGSKPMTYDNIREVEYLEMVINETLRISPPATRTDRVCLKDTEVNGIKIPAGMNISVPIYGIHHDPDNWKDPEKFIPERFAEKDSYDPMTFLPFGYGPRICIGMRLVQMELKLSLAKVIRNFRISISKETQIPPEMMKLGLLKPKTVKLKLEEIK